MVLMPIILFWTIILLGGGILGWRGILIFVLIWLASLICFVLFHVSPYYFVAFQALLDAVLIIVLRAGGMSVG